MIGPCSDFLLDHGRAFSSLYQTARSVFISVEKFPFAWGEKSGISLNPDARNVHRVYRKLHSVKFSISQKHELFYVSVDDAFVIELITN